MLTRTSHLALPRRVTAWYLLFGLAAVAWILLGLPTLLRAFLNSQAESAWLGRMGRAAPLAVSAWRQGGVSEWQPLVEQIRQESNVAWCAVSGADGTYLAHSDSNQVGKPAEEPQGAVDEWGDVRRTRFVDQHDRTLNEYRMPLRANGNELGILRMATADVGGWPAVLSTLQQTSWMVLGPAAVVAAGAVVLRRLVRPLAEIEGQLRQAAATPTQAFAYVPVTTPGAIGLAWNRLVEGMKREPAAGLQARLSNALEGFRQRKAEQVLNGLPDGVAVTDPGGKVTFANPAFAALVGSDQAPIGRLMAECLALDDAHGESPLLNPELALREVVVEEGRGGDMSRGVLRVARYPLRGSADSPGQGHIWSIRDVTQQKLADQMRNQFVYSATHELRTPLANIKAYAETLALTDQLDVERQKEFCNTINSEATRLARFIDDLLSISRMQAGSMSLDRQSVELPRLLDEIVLKVRPQMTSKRISFEQQVPDKLPELRLDKDKFTVTLVNLLGNAAKYTPPGGRVALAIEQTAQTLLIHIEDSGIGISVEDLPKVFDKFFRSSDPRVQDETGSGLGLSLAQEVARLHGGKLTVHSELNKGTKFTFSIPLQAG